MAGEAGKRQKKILLQFFLPRRRALPGKRAEFWFFHLFFISVEMQQPGVDVAAAIGAVAASVGDLGCRDS